MKQLEGRITELRLDEQGQSCAWIMGLSEGGPRSGWLSAGQYFQAWAPHEPWAARATTLFPREIGAQGFLTCGPLPPTWGPGTRLQLRGPWGRGFQVNPGTRQMALVILGTEAGRLLPLISPALERGASVTLCTDGPLPALPLAVEVVPLSTLPEVLAWADFLALDLPASAFPTLSERLQVETLARLPAPAQALVTIPMPCAGLGECGACTVMMGSRRLRLCEEGPVVVLTGK